MTLGTLSFGYNAGLPDDALAAWGARFIVTQDGHVDLPHDRHDALGDDDLRPRFLAAMQERLPAATLFAILRSKLIAGEIKTREASEVAIFEDDDIKVVGNSNASAGYFYLVAYLKPFPDVVGWEATCEKCGEVFNPADPLDLVHLVRMGPDENGKYETDCGGRGVLNGSWK